MAKQRWYGSLQNRLMEAGKAPAPQVGMGATECLWSDRHAYVVVAVKDDRHCTVRRLEAKNTAEWPEQDYIYYDDPHAVNTELFRKKDGRWVSRIGRREYNTFVIGFAEEYEDPSF